MKKDSDIDGLFGKIARDPLQYQELTAAQKADSHISRWTLLHDIHAAYRVAAREARLLPLKNR